MDVGKKSVLSSFIYLVFSCSIGSLSLFLLLDNFNNAKADFSVAEKHLIGFEPSKKSHIHTKNSKPFNYRNLSKRFDDAYFKYSRPFEKSTGFGYRLGQSLGIVIGGRNNPRAIALGNKVDAIKWESLAIENLYKDTVIPRVNQTRFISSDIESGFCSSLLYDECL